MKLSLGLPRMAARKPRTGAGKGNLLGLIVIAFVIGAVALLLGAVIGLGSPFLLTMLAGVIFGSIVFLIMDSYLMLLTLFVLTFLVQGTAMSFFGNRQAPWVVVGVAVLFVLRTILDRSFARNVAKRGATSGADTAALVALLMYALVFAASTVINRPGMAQLVVAFKSAWPMLAVLLALMWFRWTPAQQARIWQLMVVVLFVQVPVVLYQHFVIAPRRVAAAHDAVVGTFGGTVTSGGNSALLAMFAIIVMSYMLVRWDRGLVTRRWMLTVCAIGMAVILLGEVKAAFFWMPLAFCFVLRRRIAKNVFSFVWYLTIMAVLGGVIWTTYNALYWSNIVNRKNTVTEKLEASGGYFFDPNEINYLTGEVGRGASLAIWAKDHSATAASRLIGYGPGAIKSGGSLGTGTLARRFAPLQVDPISLTVLLWDVGILGAAAYLSLFATVLLAGWRYLRRRQGEPGTEAIIEASVVTVLLLSTLVIYNRTLMDDPAVQLLFALASGLILNAARFAPKQRPAVTPKVFAVAPPAPPRMKVV